MLAPGHVLWRKLSLPSGFGLKSTTGHQSGALLDSSYSVLPETMAVSLKSNSKHLLVAVKQDSEVSSALTWVLLHMCRPGDRITVLSVSRPSVSTEFLTGRVLEPLGDEDMTLTALHSAVEQSLKRASPGQFDLRIQLVVSADVRGALLSATETLKPDVLILGSSGSVPSALHSSFSSLLPGGVSSSASSSSLSRHLVQHASCSVLVVKDDF